MVLTLGILGHGVGLPGDGQGTGALSAGGIGRHRVGGRAGAGPARADGDRDPVIIMTGGGPGAAVRGGDGHRARSAKVLERWAGWGNGGATPAVATAALGHGVGFSSNGECPSTLSAG